MFDAGGKIDERWPEESCEKAWALELADHPVRLQAGRVQPEDGQGDGDQGGQLEDEFVTPSEGGPNNNYCGNDDKMMTFTSRRAAPRMMMAMMW